MSRIELEFVAHLPGEDGRLIVEGGDHLAQIGQVVLSIAAAEEGADEQIGREVGIDLGIEAFIARDAERHVGIEIGKGGQNIEAGKSRRMRSTMPCRLRMVVSA